MSEEEAVRAYEENFWYDAYQEFFGQCFVAPAMGAVCDKWQEPEIDRLVYLGSDHIYRIKEFLMLPPETENIWLELGYDAQRNYPGWIERETRNDYIAFGFPVPRKCLILEMRVLRRAYCHNRQKWRQSGKIQRLGQGHQMRVYLSVPISTVLRGIASASQFTL